MVDALALGASRATYESSSLSRGTWPADSLAEPIIINLYSAYPASYERSEEFSE